MDFVDREDELAWLEERYRSDQAEFIVLYGRRRVGKSELVRYALQGHEAALYYQARETSQKIQLEDFVDVAKSLEPDVEDLKPDWERYLHRLAEHDPILVIDEFPYLVSTDPSLPSTIQRAWDLVLKDTKTKLILVGSSLSVMEDEVLSSKSPLFGRRTGTLDLAPMSLWEAEGFLEGFDADGRILAWSIFGGMPHSLEKIDPSDTLLENVDRLILDQGAPLHDEGQFLIHQEFHEPATYVAILETIAAGKRETNEIAQATGIETKSIGTYLRKLRRIRLIERHVPITEDPTRSKTSRYRLADPFLGFWFRFVWRERSRLEREDRVARRLVEPHLADHAAPYFEVICQAVLPDLVETSYTAIGAWWHKEEEIDIVGLTDEDTLVVGECKFTSSPMQAQHLYALENKASNVRWTPPSGGPFDPEFVLFSRSGFEASLESIGEEREDVHLFDLEDIVHAR